MHLHIISIGKNMPAWINQGVDDYLNRFPAKFSLNLFEVPMPKRSKTASVTQLIEKESQLILEKIPNNHLIIALEVKGKSLSTPELANKLECWQQNYSDINFIVGGPDGLSPEIQNKAHFKWSLSSLTFPHPIVRIIVAEQLYRAWSILTNHPYHRESR